MNALAASRHPRCLRHLGQPHKISQKIGSKWSSQMHYTVKNIKDDMEINIQFMIDKVIIIIDDEEHAFLYPGLEGRVDRIVGRGHIVRNKYNHDIEQPENIYDAAPAGGAYTNQYDPKLIYDFGMHDGADTEFYLKKGFNVVAIEANPYIAASVNRRLKKFIDADKLKILNICAHNNSGDMAFYVNKEISQYSSFDLELASRHGGEIEKIYVPAAKPIEIFKKFGTPYYVKIDIEGADKYVVEDIHRMSVRPPYLSYENGGGYIFDILCRSGYNSFKFVDQSAHNKQPLPFPALEGDYICHEFPIGSSGPFAEETSGGWLSYNEISEFINQIDLNRKIGKKTWNGTHVDLHARQS
ncbi:MAG: FkbM family methyltransferase [Limnospira maxima]